MQNLNLTSSAVQSYYLVCKFTSLVCKLPTKHVADHQSFLLRSTLSLDTNNSVRLQKHFCMCFGRFKQSTLDFFAIFNGKFLVCKLSLILGAKVEISLGSHS